MATAWISHATGARSRWEDARSNSRLSTIVLACEEIEGQHSALRSPCHGKAVRQTLSPDFDAGALVGAVTEFGNGQNLVKIVSAGRFDRRGFLFRRKERIAKRWLLQQVQKIGRIAPTAGAPRRAKALTILACSGEVVASCLRACGMIGRPLGLDRFLSGR
jgi:hypothetical protein